MNLFLTCEHAGKRVPEEYQSYFDGMEDLLQSHRGWDPGALPVSQILSDSLKSPLEYTDVTRLLTDCNRSAGNRTLFSEITRPLSPEIRENILAHYYHPFRSRAEKAIRDRIGTGNTVLHLAVHTFTPVWKERRRTTDIGILYDWNDPAEKSFSTRWKKTLQEYLPGLRIHLNRPYTGVSDGFQTELKKKLPAGQYLGITLEVNHRFFYNGDLDEIAIRLSESLKALNAISS
jgi:predicted N-formylglutamate amidohydrolase